MSNFSEMLLKAYEPRLRDHFRNHPKCDEIIAKFKAGEYSVTGIDKVFAEAEQYSWTVFNETAEKKRPIVKDALGNEYVVFEIHKDENG